MLVGEEAEHREPARPVEEAEPREPAEKGQRNRGEEVVHARRHEGRGDAEARGHGVEPLRAIHVDILAGVEHVEARDPHREREPQDERRRVEGAAHGDPAPGRRDPVGEAEDPVRGPGEALRVGVADEEDEGERREREAERVVRPPQRTTRGEQFHLGRTEHAAREMTTGGPRVARVDGAIDDAIRRHRARARADHRRRHPAERPPAGPAARGQDHRDVGEREREDRVLELDRVEHAPGPVQSP